MESGDGGRAIVTVQVDFVEWPWDAMLTKVEDEEVTVQIGAGEGKAAECNGVEVLQDLIDDIFREVHET